MRLLRIVAVLAIAAGVIWIVAEYWHNPKGSRPSTTVPATSPTTPTNPLPPAGPTTSPTGQPPVTGPTSPLAPRTKALLTAAALANSSLSAAQLMPDSQRRAIVNEMVVPSKRPQVLAVLAFSGQKVLRKFWGYTTLKEAEFQATYYVVTQMFKIDWIKAGNAEVSLYTFTHFKTKDDWKNQTEHWDAGITVLSMRRMNGRWLYVGAHDPPAGQMPAPEVGLSFDQTKQRFQPYLRGYRNYANT